MDHAHLRAGVHVDGGTRRVLLLAKRSHKEATVLVSPDSRSVAHRARANTNAAGLQLRYRYDVSSFFAGAMGSWRMHGGVVGARMASRTSAAWFQRGDHRAASPA